jgi:hypothetical protein
VAPYVVKPVGVPAAPGVVPDVDGWSGVDASEDGDTVPYVDVDPTVGDVPPYTDVPPVVP